MHENLKKSNPDYEVILWTLDNITHGNFPLTFEFIQKYLKSERKGD